LPVRLTAPVKTLLMILLPPLPLVPPPVSVRLLRDELLMTLPFDPLGMTRPPNAPLMLSWSSVVEDAAATPVGSKLFAIVGSSIVTSVESFLEEHPVRTEPHA